MSLDEILGRTQIETIMTADVQTAAIGTPLRQSLERMVNANVGSLVVMAREGNPLFLRDVAGLAPVFLVLRKFMTEKDENAPIETAMITDFITAAADETVSGVMGRIVNNKTWRLIVTGKDDRVVGLLSATDIMRLLASSSSERDKAVKIGVNGSFHRVLFNWSKDSVVLTREDDYVTEIRNVVRVEEEFARLEESEQDILLVRFHDRQGGVRTLFIDNDPVQTNVREVAGELERLDQVFEWLLPSGYVIRQGDVGLYRRDTLPTGAERIPADLYPDRFIDVLSKRHGFEPEDACEFYAAEGRLYVRVTAGVHLIHPEHTAVPLDLGLYELVGARGTPLPHFVGLRAGETASMEEK